MIIIIIIDVTALKPYILAGVEVGKGRMKYKLALRRGLTRGKCNNFQLTLGIGECFLEMIVHIGPEKMRRISIDRKGKIRVCALS